MTVSPLLTASLPDASLAATTEISGPSYESTMKDFEAVFVSMLLKEMRQTLGEGFFGDDKADAIGGLFDMTFGQEIGRQGGLGIAAALSRYREIAEQQAAAPPGEPT